MRDFLRLELTALLLRLSLGLVALTHGLLVIRHGWGTNWEAVLPLNLHTAAAWVEIVAGGLLIVGLFTRPAALLLAILAGAGGWIALKQRPLFSNEPPVSTVGGDVLTVAAEYSIALLLISVAVAILGAGLISLDRLFGKLIRRKSREAVSSVLSPSPSPPPPKTAR